MPAMNKHSMILGLAVLLGMTACGNAAGSSEPASTPPTTATTTDVTDDSAATPVTTAGSAYATKAFNLPFDVTLPGWLDATPSVEQPNFVTWQSPTADRAVRFLIPVNVYPPGGTGPTSPPPDYLHYLLAQTDHGAHFADQTPTMVGGKPATIVTATVDNSLDGSLGCPDTVTPANDCFGLQPDLVLRIAVVDTGTTPLLIWLRGTAGTDMTADNASFADLLTTIRFSDRPVQAPTTTTTAVGVATPLDGTYRWTITAADAMAYGTPNDKTPESQATFPWIFTVTLYDGHSTMKHRDATGEFDDGEGTYTVDGDRLVIDLGGGNLATNTVRVDADGTLHLTAQDATDPGGVFVTTTKPWTRIAGGADTTATVLDGTYRWTLTKDDALTHGLPQDRTPEVLATYPSEFTMTMNAGHWTLHHDGVSGEVAGGGTYTVDGDHVRFDWDSNVLTFAFSVDRDGTLHLEPQPQIDPGDAFVWATNPWTKID